MPQPESDVPEPQNQHLVPRFYLRNFTPAVGQKVVWVYTKSDPTRPQWRSPRDAASIDNFYTQRRSDGSADLSIEKWFANEVETKAAPAIRRMINSEPPVYSDRHNIAFFMACLMARTIGPAERAKQFARKLEGVNEAIAFIEERRDKLVARFGEAEVQEHIEMIRREGKAPALPSGYYLRWILRFAANWSYIIHDLCWCVMRCESPTFFVTSDTPVFSRIPQKVTSRGPAPLKGLDRRVQLGFPLSTHSFLIASWTDSLEGAVRCSPAQTRELNRRTVISAHEHVFSPCKSVGIQALVVEHKDFQVVYPDD